MMFWGVGVLILCVEEEEEEETREQEYGSEAEGKFACTWPSRQEAFGLSFQPLTHTHIHTHLPQWRTLLTS